MIKPHYYLAVLLFVVTAFLLCMVPIKAKSALGVPDFTNASVLGKADSNALTLLEKSLSYRLAVLGNSNVPEAIPPKTPNQISSNTDLTFNPKFWNKEVNFNGNRVFQRNDLIDTNKIDPKTGLTNLELMKSGRAPKGPDGKPVNLHHLTQRHDGGIAEVTQTFHQKNSSTIHINPSSTPSGINRSQFNKWRADYWKERAKDF